LMGKVMVKRLALRVASAADMDRPWPDTSMDARPKGAAFGALVPPLNAAGDVGRVGE
jgi:hypothetical protein